MRNAPSPPRVSRSPPASAWGEMAISACRRSRDGNDPGGELGGVNTTFWVLQGKRGSQTETVIANRRNADILIVERR